MTQPSWPERVAARSASAVRLYRELRGLSAQQLSDECAKLGMPIQRSVIANFENGRRASVGVAEILVFAAVLQVPPVELICPTGYQRQIEILPGDIQDSYRAACWITGENSREDELDGPDELPYFQTPLHFGRLLFEAIMGVEYYIDQLAVAERSSSEVATELARAEEKVSQLAVLSERLFTEWATRQNQFNEETDPDEMQRILDAADQLREASFAARTDLARAQEEAHSLGAHKRKLLALNQGLQEEEEGARAIISQMREKDWEIPELPTRVRYLLEDVKAAPKPPRKLRKRGGD